MEKKYIDAWNQIWVRKGLSAYVWNNRTGYGLWNYGRGLRAF